VTRNRRSWDEDNLADSYDSCDFDSEAGPSKDSNRGGIRVAEAVEDWSTLAPSGPAGHARRTRCGDALAVVDMPHLARHGHGPHRL
jgi:hypothetical protein